MLIVRKFRSDSFIIFKVIKKVWAAGKKTPIGNLIGKTI